MRCAMVLAVAMLLAGAAGAQATTVDYDGDTVVVTGGDNASHSVQFRISSDGQFDQILDSVAFTSAPVDCTVETVNKLVCPAHGNVKVDLGAGNDSIRFNSQGFDCFNAYELNLGDGTNELGLSDQCGPTLTGPATANSGSGDDTLTVGSQAITLNAGGGNDVLRGGQGDDVIHAGDGADTMYGGDGNDQLFGDGGADRPNGGPGNDLVDGGSGDDALDFSQGGSRNDPSIGADHYVGGPGTDKLWLDERPSGVSISLNGVADDGAAGEGDNVDSDIEGFDGTSGNDVFNGSAGPEQFAGGGGSDELHGAGGDDDLHGGSGDDQIYGDGGNDTLQGSLAADTVDGGPGTDQIYGDSIGCTYSCSADADRLFARDGERDAVDCGGGADTAQVDGLDVVAFCAVVDRGTTQQPPPALTASFRATGKMSRAKGIGVTVTCPGACAFTVKLGISAKIARKAGLGRKALTIGTARGSLAAAGDKKVTVKLSAKALKKLKRLKNVAAKLTVAVKDASGTTTTNKAITTRR